MVNLLIAVSLGCLLGTRYSLLVLIPAAAFMGALDFRLAASVLGETAGSWESVLLVACGLQGGYMIGLTLREYGEVFAPRRPNRQARAHRHKLQ